VIYKVGEGHELPQKNFYPADTTSPRLEGEREFGPEPPSTGTAPES